MRKIMFDDKFGLTEAVLNREKTMTRRVIKGDYVKIAHLKHEGTFIGKIASGDSVIPPQPAYNVGEEIAIAQNYKSIYEELEEKKGNSKANEWWCNLYERIGDPTKHAGYRNKMFVRADLMPHRIRITKTKLERLQDISEEECLKEGVEKWIDCYIVTGIMENQGKNNVCFDTPREAFAALIDRISGKGTWESNPWVFAYEFELLHFDGWRKDFIQFLESEAPEEHKAKKGQ